MSEENNRRAFKRLPAASQIEIWTAEHRWTGTLANQSLGGIGLTVESESERLSIGEEVRIQYDDTEAIGFVRYIRENDDGSAFMGIAWDQRELPRKPRKTDAVFFVNGPLEVVCRSCELDEENSTAKFKLWDGAEFNEDASHLVTRDLAEREELLAVQELEDLATLLKLYDLGDADNPKAAVERVIDFEFTR